MRKVRTQASEKRDPAGDLTVGAVAMTCRAFSAGFCPLMSFVGAKPLKCFRKETLAVIKQVPVEPLLLSLAQGVELSAAKSKPGRI
ncbi:DNA-binding transcriptional regulator of sugar metabolism [Pseudomonas syringae pv. actinidiae]|uniref:DNA-binding transcriptional regulator of sugar metabolism n=1 Tax=Pseudomonas syringae pv. actinidiae TaxID=103796 RepID=A0A2V0QDZ5_PSESF|nr:DNA-binding transcriptional regulator of sugar metabolism [Pseudomonas syringae pv. actinidiae]